MPPPVVRLRIRRHQQHPWIFQGMIRAWDKAAQPGDWVGVVDKEGSFVGHGFFNPRSQISVRLVSFDPRAEDPLPSIAEGIRRAAALRRTLLDLETRTNAYRIVNSEGDGLSGLVADRYGDAIVLELFSIWPLVHLPAVEEAFAGLFPGARLFLRADSRIQTLEGFRAPGERMPKGTVEIREDDLRLRVNLSGHKTGAFLDQRDNRRFVRELSHGKKVLDCCCYTGGFSIQAALGKAAEAIGVDLDKSAIDTARENARLNKATVDWVHADLFPYLRDAKRHKKRYDFVILDPPKFAASREELKAGLDKYFDLNRAALDVLAPEGILVSCSCSGVVSDEAFLGMLQAVSTAVRRELQIFRLAHAAPDHPFQINCPESRYLKVVFAKVE